MANGSVIASTRRVRGNLPRPNPNALPKRHCEASQRPKQSRFSLPHSRSYGPQVPEIATSGQKTPFLAITVGGCTGTGDRRLPHRTFGTSRNDGGDKPCLPIYLVLFAGTLLRGKGIQTPISPFRAIESAFTRPVLASSYKYPAHFVPHLS